jgi:tRNA threonylcarbamoyladenosine biosynthesis protein TsaE
VIARNNVPVPIAFSHLLEQHGATSAFGVGLASVLLAGDVIALEGDLGAGKTTLARAICLSLGAPRELLASPTFVLMHQYPLPPDSPARTLAHIDAYRMRATDDLDVLGWDQVFDDSGRARADTIALVEWPQRLPRALAACARIELAHEPGGSRTVRATLPDSWAQRPLVRVLAQRDPVRCPRTGAWVSPTEPGYPFASSRARDADLYRWLTEGYVISTGLDSVQDDSDDPARNED